MRPKVKKARREASLLYGADATYVSLVDRGANETPFKLIKTAKGTGAMPIKKRTTTPKSHKTVGNKKKAADAATSTTVMAKMIFSGDHFEDEAEVLEAVAKMEWDAEDIKVAETESGDFEVRSGDMADEDYDRLSKVETDEEGVEAWVGVYSASDDDAADPEEDDDAEEEGEDDPEEEVEAVAKTAKKKPVAKKAPAKTEDEPAPLSKRQEFLAKRAAAKVTKFDRWDAEYSKGNTLSKALRDGMSYDATPPGYYDVQSAFNAAVANIVGGDGVLEGTKQEALNKAAADYAEIIGGLDSFFDAYVEADEQAITKSFEDAKVREAIAKWADEYGDFAAGNTTAPLPEVSTKSEAGSAAIDYKRVEDMIKTAFEGVSGQVESVSKTVVDLASRRPTKKGADAEEGQNALEQKRTPDADDPDEWARKKTNKSLMG